MYVLTILFANLTQLNHYELARPKVKVQALDIAVGPNLLMNLSFLFTNSRSSLLFPFLSYNMLFFYLNDWIISWSTPIHVFCFFGVGGSESEMFNELEDIANRDVPETPVLGFRLTAGLQPRFLKKRGRKIAMVCHTVNCFSCKLFGSYSNRRCCLNAYLYSTGYVADNTKHSCYDTSTYFRVSVRTNTSTRLLSFYICSNHPYMLL